MVLKAVTPEIVKVSKPKLMLSGKSGIGKTWFALDFPKPYYIDSEGGAVRQKYIEKLIASGGMYFGKDEGSRDFATVIEEVKELATTKHGFKTLVIDSFSYLYNSFAAIAEERVGSDYGRDKKEANKPSRQLSRWIDRLDMSVVLICHHKEKWERRGNEVINVGSTFDGYDKLEYGLDLWCEVQKLGKSRNLCVKKSRVHSLPEGKEVPLDFKIFAQLYGDEIIDKEAVPVRLASVESIQKMKTLIEVVKITPEETEKWFAKAEVDSWEEMTEDQIRKCIDYLDKKLTGVK